MLPLPHIRRSDYDFNAEFTNYSFMFFCSTQELPDSSEPRRVATCTSAAVEPAQNYMTLNKKPLIGWFFFCTLRDALHSLRVQFVVCYAPM